jgi:hypothetical protein
MGKGAATSELSFGENISHFAAIRVRLNGVGDLKMKVFSLDDERVKILVPFSMSYTSRTLPTRIVNFMEQRAAFELRTSNIDEKFRINRIVIFVKEVFKSHPG